MIFTLKRIRRKELEINSNITGVFDSYIRREYVVVKNELMAQQHPSRSCPYSLGMSHTYLPSRHSSANRQEAKGTRRVKVQTSKYVLRENHGTGGFLYRKILVSRKLHHKTWRGRECGICEMQRTKHVKYGSIDRHELPDIIDPQKHFELFI